MPDWENYKGVEIPEATPTGAAGLRLKDNFIYVADQLETLQGDLSGLSINDLAGVNISSPTTGEALVYDGSDWTNAGLSINDLAGVNISSPTTGEALVFDGSDWTNAPATGGGLTITSKTSNYTAAPGDLVICNVSGGSFTVSLPAITANALIGIKLGTGAGSNTVTISPNGSDQIDHQTSVVLYLQNDYLEIQGDLASGQWRVVQNGVQPNAEVWATSSGSGSAGHGTTNTKIRRYSSTNVIKGTAITFADDSALGSSFTINESGLYEITRCDSYSALASNCGASVDSNQLTTAVFSITLANQLPVHCSLPVGGVIGVATATVRLSAGNIVRSHDNINLCDGTGPNRWFRIVKVGN